MIDSKKLIHGVKVNIPIFFISITLLLSFHETIHLFEDDWVFFEYFNSLCIIFLC